MNNMKPQITMEGGHFIMSHPQNSGLPKVKDGNVNDRDRTQDLLAQEKYLTASYNTALHEMGHDELAQVVKQNFDDCHKMQRKLFNLMFQKGWYKLPVAAEESVTHTLSQFRQYQSQLPFPSGIKPAKSQQAQNQQPTMISPAFTAAAQGTMAALPSHVQQ